jgi:hypothetical protein
MAIAANLFVARVQYGGSWNISPAEFGFTAVLKINHSR